MIKIISGLTEGQVLQRLGPHGANLRLTLLGNKGDALHVTISDSKGRALKSWSKRHVGTGTGGKHAVTLKQIPAGGPYRLAISAGKSSAVIKLFFVGDVWLLAGQSNMEGCGNRTGAAKPQPLLRAFSMRREWRRAEEPLHFCPESPDECHNMGTQCSLERSEQNRKNNERGVGAGLFFAHQMLAKSGVPQGLLCTAHGGTSMTQWDPALKSTGGKSLYASMLASVRATGQPVAGVLWYQGESDANRAAAGKYTDRMKTLVSSTRRDLKQPALPWVVVQLGRVFGVMFDPPTYWNSIQEQQRKLARSLCHLDVVAAIDLPLDDNIHISSAGFPLLAKRMADVAERLVYRKGRGTPAPQPRRIRLNPMPGAQTITVSYDGVRGGLRAGGEPHGFDLVDAKENSISRIFKTTLEGNNVVLHVGQLALDGTRLCYGNGFAPICNITDARGHALPVFAPQFVQRAAAFLPFITAWNLTPVIPAEKSALAKLKVKEMDHPALETKTYGNDGFVNEHARWPGQSGHIYFSSKMDLPEAMELEALMGYDGPFRAWIDDDPLFTNMDGINPCVADESRKRRKLAKGPHLIRVAMDINGGLAWGFFLRFKRVDVTRAQIVSVEYAKPVFYP